MIRAILALLALLAGAPAYAQGVIPLALQQQFSVNGQPLSGALLYTYVAGTVSAPLNTYQDFGLTLQNPWPLQADATGRIPMFYLPNGQVHVRLTDQYGVVILDYPTMQVVGPSSGGGGGGGGSIDPTTIASTGDIKYRATGETITGWVKANGLTIGNATSGATGRANADTQNLFVYLWTNCTNAHCPVPGGRGASALADFSANKQITVFDFRGRIPFGLDDMGNTAAGRLTSLNMSGSGDTPTTPAGFAGYNSWAILQAQIPNYALSATTTVTDTRSWAAGGSGVGGSTFAGLSGAVGVNVPVNVISGTITASTSVNSGGSGSQMNFVSQSLLGSFYIKL